MNHPAAPRIQQQLAKLVASLPAIQAASVVHVDGWTLVFYGQRDVHDEQRIEAKAGAFQSLGWHIAAELALGEWQYMISIGRNGSALYVPLTEAWGLVLIVEPGTALDGLLAGIVSSCGSITEFLAADAE